MEGGSQNGGIEPAHRPSLAGRSSTTGRASTAGRVAAAIAVLAALVAVGVIVLSNGSSYTLDAVFEDASGLVHGNLVLIGPAKVGTVTAIGLTRNGSAEVTMSLDSDAAPLRQGTVARIYEDSLSGIASKYVELEPAPSGPPPIPNGGQIDENHTYSSVSLDEVFDTLDPLTRAGLKGVIRGEAASLQDRGELANRALQYLAPGLQSTSQVTAELTRDQPEFDQLVVSGAQAMQALASKSQQLTQLISNTSTATAAIGRQGQALQEDLTLFPGTLTRSTTTFAGLQTTLDALDPLVAASKPAVRRLPEFAARLRTLIDGSIPTVSELNGLIHNPAGAGDLTELARQTPSLARLGSAVFPRLVTEMNLSQAQLDYLREYAPDVVAALTNLGQSSAYYDANGHYVRTQPALFPFALTGSNQLTTQFPSERYKGLHLVHDRCPGSAVQPSPDGSTPKPVRGCASGSVPPGP